MHSRKETIQIQQQQSDREGQKDRRSAFSQKSKYPRTYERNVKAGHTDHMYYACRLILIPDFSVDQAALSQKHSFHDRRARSAVCPVPAAENIICQIRQMGSQDEKRRLYGILSTVIGENAGITECKQIASDHTVIHKRIKLPVVGRLSEKTDPAPDPHRRAFAGPLFLQLRLLLNDTQYFVSSFDLKATLFGDLRLKGDIIQSHFDVLFTSRIHDGVFLFFHYPSECHISSLCFFSDGRFWGCEKDRYPHSRRKEHNKETNRSSQVSPPSIFNLTYNGFPLPDPARGRTERS